MRPPVSIVTNVKSAIGKAVVRRLAFAGHNVAAVDTCRGSVSAIAEDNKKVGTKVTAFVADLTLADHRKEFIERVVKELGGLDSIVIVPPTNTIRGDIMDTTSMQFDSMFSYLLTSPFRLIQTAMPVLKDSENPGIVLVTSAAGYAPQIDGGLHSIASVALLSMVKSFARCAAKRNIRVNGVCTGMIEGDGSGAVWDDMSKNEQAEQIRQNLQAMIPLGRIGRPSDVASTVEFLLSDRAKYITGENVIVNGGVSFRI